MNTSEVDAKLSFKSLDFYNTSEIKKNVSTSDELYYSVKGEKLSGRCLIFNFEEFEDPSLSYRNGSKNDADSLIKTFDNIFQFDVEVHTNLRYSKLIDKLENVSSKGNIKYDCLVVCILSHGRKDGTLCASDKDFETEELFSYFTADRCQWLIGKPKIFIIQACRGEKFDSGSIARDGQSVTKEGFYKIPNYADFLFCYSSYPGYYSWRNQSGSWFIQSFCGLLKEHYKNHDLMTILTLTVKKVALEYESSSNDRKFNRKKQIPFIASTLTRLIGFNLRK